MPSQIVFSERDSAWTATTRTPSSLSLTAIATPDASPAPRARRHHARRELVPGELRHVGEGPAHLERPGELEVLGLQHRRRAEPARELTGREQRCPADEAVDCALGTFDVLDGDRARALCVG